MSDRLLSHALLWTIARRDGVTITLTGHDRDLHIGGVTYRAAPGMTPAAIERRDGLDPAATDVRGALTADAITEGDLLAGRWDGARVTVAMTDWSAPDTPALLATGTIGAVEIDGSGFGAELRGPAAALDRPVAEETSAECRAVLGDRRCRVAMAGRRRFARVVSADGGTLTLDTAEPVADAYGGGTLHWFGGENTGLVSAVARSQGAVAMLRMPPPFVPRPGTLVELVEGCDKSIATCAGRFGNAANFRGEPYLPGIDLLTRYPG